MHAGLPITKCQFVSSMTVSIRVISDPSQLLEIEGVWNTFVNKHSENPIFLSGFVNQFMKFYRLRGWTPLALIISFNRVIVGIAPLMTKKKFGVRFVKFLCENCFSPDFILEEQYRETCIAHTLDFLFKTVHCQFCDLTLPVESINLRVLKQKCDEKRIYICTKRGRWAEMGHNILFIGYSWGEFKKLRGKNFRRRFRRLKRNLDRAGSWSIVCFENGDRIQDAFKRILDVERMSWKEAWRTRKRIKIDHGLLMIWKGLQHTVKNEPDLNWTVRFLELDEQPLAYSLIIQYKEMAFCMKTSYDDRYKRFYPGIYINNEAIRELFNKRQVKKIDFLTKLPFHRNWTSIWTPRARVIMSRKSLIPAIIGYMLASEHTKNILSVIPAHVSERFIGE